MEYAVRFSLDLIEFIWLVFNQLDLVLPEKQSHPYARGWSRIFTTWAKIDAVQKPGGDITNRTRQVSRGSPKGAA